LRLSPRLAAIAELAAPGRPLADIGTDHALLPAALVLRGSVPWALACDRAAEPLARARATIDRLGLAERIALRRGDGLTALAVGEVETAVIAGVGARSAVAILAGGPAQLRRLSRVIVQVNYGSEEVRRWLVDHGLRLVDERLVEDRERFYTAIAAEPAPGADAPAWSRAAWVHGPVVLRRGGPALARCLAAELRRCERAERRGRADTADRRAVVAEALAESRAVGASSSPG
jgi:tRNA (adenine22-N1)-methyltransferase